MYYDHRNQTGLRNAARLPNFPRVWRLVYLGFPAATQFGMEVGVFAAATMLIGRLGAAALASHQVALNTVSLTYMVPLGISAAAAVRVGQALGRNDAHAASRAGWTAMLLGAAFMGCMAIAFLVVPRQIVRVYTPDAALIPRRQQVAFCRGVFSAVRRHADSGDRRFARSGRHAHADALPFVFLLGGGFAAGGAALFSFRAGARRECGRG